MSFFSRRSRRAGTAKGLACSLIHWLTGSVLAVSGFSAALPARASQPYLATLSPLSLRFAPPPPDLSTEPTPAAPPNPDGVIGDVAQSNHEAVAPVPVPEPAVRPVEVIPAETVPEAPAAAEPPVPSSRPPVEIIPDDFGAPVMPEDLLPFFLPPQIPSAPQSQATYRLK